MSSNQVSSQIAAQIHGLLTNSMSGAVFITLFIIFLPKDIMNILEFLEYLVDNNLVTTPVLIVFVTISYMIGQMVQAFTGFIPFRGGIFRVLYHLPFTPKFDPNYISEDYQNQFLWAYNHLFQDPEEISPTTMDSIITYSKIKTSAPYLEYKNIQEIQRYKNISSTFRQLEVLFTFFLVYSSILIYFGNISTTGLGFSDFKLPLISFSIAVIFWMFNFLADVFEDSSEDSHNSERALNRKVNRRLLFSSITTLALMIFISSPILLIFEIYLDYIPNIKTLLGPTFVYSPFIFIILIYSSAYVKFQYSKLMRECVVRNLYVVAVSEGDIEKMGW